MSTDRRTVRQIPFPQAKHGSSHLELQQTPSTQKPDIHWLPELQSCPFGWLGDGGAPQAPAPLQVAPPVHSASGLVPIA